MKRASSVSSTTARSQIADVFRLRGFALIENIRIGRHHINAIQGRNVAAAVRAAVREMLVNSFVIIVIGACIYAAIRMGGQRPIISAFVCIIVAVTGPFLFALALSHAQRGRRFPRRIVITEHGIVVSRRDQSERFFELDECRWWHGVLASDNENGGDGSVKCIVIQCRIDTLTPIQFGICADASASKRCAFELSRCRVLHERPASLTRGYSCRCLGGVAGVLGATAACFGWQWTTGGEPLRASVIVYEICAWSLFGVVAIGNVLVAWEPYFFPRRTIAPFALGALFGGIQGVVAGCVGGPMHVVYNACIAWIIFAIAARRALRSVERTEENETGA